MERLSPLWRVFFVRGRVHENPQEFFGKRSFALLIVVYRSLFGIVWESLSLARTLAGYRLPPPLGGVFLVERKPLTMNLRIQQTDMNDQ